jgi:tetraacyldisaccharide 4'-kinase
MSQNLDTRIRQIMSGQSRGLGAGLARVVLACVEPVYTLVVGARNHLFDRQLMRSSRLPRPVISVGNLTTGGTGKTPVVQWIVRELQAMSHKPAVLMRGYKRVDAQSRSDEEQLLRDSLAVPVFADPRRFLAGQHALKAHPEIDVFVLDDGFQHRKLARDLDIVLIDATNPFGYDHVLPRGMLRESLAGLARVGVVILTRVDLAPAEQLEEIESTVRSANTSVPMLRTIHRLGEVQGDGNRKTLEQLSGNKVWAFCGIGNPEAFENALRKAGVELAGVTRFGDHHPYDPDDLDRLRAAAKSAGATVLLTTEKDFVKLRELPSLMSTPIPVLSVGVQIEMSESDSARLRALIAQCMRSRSETTV